MKLQGPTVRRHPNWETNSSNETMQLELQNYQNTAILSFTRDPEKRHYNR